MVDLSIHNKSNRYALYTPAISTSYMTVVSQWKEKMDLWESKTREKFLGEAEEFYSRNPKTLSPDGKELNFLDPNNQVMHYNAALYSAGHAELFRDDVRVKAEALVANRNRQQTTVIADSGGFQISSMAKGSAVFGFDWENRNNPKNDDLRMAILRWMENTADWSMTLDFPTHSIDNPFSPVKSFKDCLESSLYNYNFFVKHRIEGKTKFLNVLQGRNWSEAEIWWDAVKDFPFESWAFAGCNTKNFAVMLKRLIIMRDTGYLNKDKHWIHVLGTSRLSSAIALTTVQQALQNNIADNITISYDSSTAFMAAATGAVFSHASFDKNNLGLSCRNAGFTQRKEAVRSKLLWPFISPYSNYITIGDIAVRDPIKWKSTTTWDQFSYSLAMANNLGILLNAIQMANRIADMPYDEQEPFIPADLIWFQQFCPEVFKSETPFDLIDENSARLTKLVGVEAENLVSQIENEHFEFEKQAMTKPSRKKVYKADKPKPEAINAFFEDEDGTPFAEDLTCFNEQRKKA